MDLKDLIVFQTVAKEKNITKAAQELNFVQSNITTRIQKLESILNTKLFYRHRHGVTLTSTGKIFLKYTDRILKLFSEAQKAIISENLPQGPLIIGSMETTAAVRLPKILTRFNELYPKVDLSLKTGPTDDLIKDVLDYKLDGAFVAGPIQNKEIINKIVFEEELVLVFNKKRTTTNKNILVFREGCSYRKRLEQWLSFEGKIPYKTIEFGTLEGILGCIEAGLGISLLPYSVIKNKLTTYQRLYYEKIPDRFSKVATCFIYRKNLLLTNTFQAFLNTLKMENGRLQFLK